MSGSEAAPGTCPAPAYRAASENCRSQEDCQICGALHITAPWLDRGSTGFRFDPPHGWHFRWRRSGRRQRLTDSKAHHGNLLLLGHDDLLGQPPDLRVAAVAKHGKRHVDRALMMRHHHRDKIGIDVAGRLHRHVAHHFFHGGDVLGQEGGFRTGTGGRCRANLRIGRRERLGRRKEGGSNGAQDR